MSTNGSKGGSKMKEVYEPLTIAFLFTVGALFNRRGPRGGSNSKRRCKIHEDEKEGLEESRGRPTGKWSWLWPDNSRFRGNLTSKFLAYFPFTLEIWYWNLTYWVYQLARAYCATRIAGNQDVLKKAEEHALDILKLEKMLGIDVELGLQRWIQGNMPWLFKPLATIYHFHILAGVLFVVYSYTYFPPLMYRQVRRTLFLNNWLAFILLTLYRCLPPRLLPPSYNYTDILHSGPQTAWTNNRFKLIIAAMPSLHFGTSAFIGWCLWRWGGQRWVRWLAPLWPVAMLTTILATANHWILDAVAGVVIVCLGWRLSWVVGLVGGCVEDWFLCVLRTERPRVWDWERIGEGAGAGWKEGRLA